MTPAPSRNEIDVLVLTKFVPMSVMRVAVVGAGAEVAAEAEAEDLTTECQPGLGTADGALVAEV